MNGVGGENGSWGIEVGGWSAIQHENGRVMSQVCIVQGGVRVGRGGKV